MEKTILDILKKINESSIEELENIKVEKSKTGKINMKMENGQKIYVIPKEYFYMVTQAVEDEKARRVHNEKRKNMLFEEENKEIFGILSENRDKAKKAKDENAHFANSKENSNAYSSTKQKRNIKNKPKSMKKQRYIAMAKKGIKGLIAVILAGTTLVTGGKAITNAIKDFNDYKNVEASVEGWSEEQIVEEAERLLKEEISEATGVDEDKISFSDKLETYSTSSETYTTIVKAGEKEYHNTEELRDLFNFNTNDTLGGKVANLISKVNKAKRSKRKTKCSKSLE